MGRSSGKSEYVRQIMAQRIRRMYTPWTYLEELISSDRGPEHNESWMTEKLQSKWPGNYKVVKDIDYQWQYVEYKIVFDNPSEETWARLQWT